MEATQSAPQNRPPVDEAPPSVEDACGPRCGKNVNKAAPVPCDVEKNTNKKKNMIFRMVVASLSRIFLLLLGYILCYLELSLILPIVAICTLVWYKNTKSEKSERIRKKVQATSMTKGDIVNIIKDLPLWVNFPDRERVEWLNEIILQLWPSLSCYIIKYCRGKIQTNIRKKIKSFRFEEIDFGNMPPKIDGVKVYKKSSSKDYIIIDFEIFYDGDCDINISLSGTQVGRIKDFQMGVEVRVVLKPLLMKMPIVGGIQIYFLNIPDIHFELEGITGFPGFNYLVRQKIEEIINKKLVFPNKITKRFTKTTDAAELKCVEAEGVLRVHVFEAKDLEKKDVTGKSDTYVVLKVGAQEHETPVIKRDLNPKWDYYCEFIVLDPVAQQLSFKVFDEDEFSEDDFLGSGAVDIYEVIKPNANDQWLALENAKHGKLHLRFSWFTLCSDSNSINAAIEETRLMKIENIHTGLLTIYIDSAKNLPKIKSYRKPDPYLILTVGKHQTKSRVKRHTCDPVWEQGFSLLVKNPETDSLIISIIDKESDGRLDRMVFNICNLIDKSLMQISKEEFEMHENPDIRITISLNLRVLKNTQFEIEESDSDPDDADVSIRRTEYLEKTFSDSPAKQSSLDQTKIIIKEETLSRGEKSVVTSTPSHTLSHFKPRPEQLGRIEVSLCYSKLRQKLLVTIHRVANLPLKDHSNIPDTYVKLELNGAGSNDIKNRTKVVVDSCDPVFEEKFEYLLSVSDLTSHQLIITVKNKKFFNSDVIGQTIIELKLLQECERSLREWYDLSEEQVSD